MKQTQLLNLEWDGKGSVHGRIVYPWGECPYCTTYCINHVIWLLEQDFDIIPEHNDGLCAGFKCSHGSPFSISVSKLD